MTILPSRHQPPLPLDRIIVGDPPDAEAVPMDVVFVGGGPAGFAGAIELANLVKRDNEAGGALGDVQIAVLEKAEGLGEHNLSGAIVNPRAMRELFPGVKDGDFPFRGPVTGERVYFMTSGKSIRLPTPPTMKNHGYFIASLSEVVRWLGTQAEALGINVFTGFPVDSLLVDGDRVAGVRTTPGGLARDGTHGSAFTPPTDLTARVTVLSEGTRGVLSQAYYEWQKIASDNPQIYALGVKEIWETKKPLDAVIHTLGWPLPPDAFGGSFVYPLDTNLLAIGLVVGLDYKQSSLDVHELLQHLKQHPLMRQYLDGGEMVEWGAKTIPEGGYYAIPKRRSGDGVIIVGDAAGYVEVASLKGIHYAMQSGMFAARAIFDALKKNDTSAASLVAYDRMVDDSYIASDLHARRNMRLVFQDRTIYTAGVQAAVMTLTNGAFPGGKIDSHTDADVPREETAAEPFVPDGKLTFSKLDANYKSGNATRDDIPSHLIVGRDIPPAVATLYQHMCPAGVYERQGDRLIVSPANCIDCKATDVIGPRWTPREGTSGPHYRRM
ncbi:MAG: electron transfer flavoprotein-ubiquinone oxidoreductase [Gemmatimonadota bacterium]|nr:electron transfer flavoprotein-ubiquinone oxidoreductase [Gemmatimonadota bacterium]